MKKLIITESEKQRILEMHKRAVRKERVLNEGPGDEVDLELYKKANVQQTTPVSADDVENGNVSTTLTDINGNQLYYTCIRDPRVSKKDADADTTYNAGSLHDRDFKDVKNNTILKAPFYEQIAQDNCRAAYSWLNSWRYENCPKLNANTHWDYSYQCSSTMAAFKRGEEQAAAAEVAAKEAKKEADIKAMQDANSAKQDQERAKINAQDYSLGASFATPFNKLYKELSDLVEGTAETNYQMGTQEQIESKINEIQTYWTDPNNKGKSVANYAQDWESNNIIKAKKFIPKLVAAAKLQYPNMTATVDLSK